MALRPFPGLDWGSAGCGCQAWERAMEWMEAVSPAWAEIDLAALRRNYRELARRVGPENKIIASIKADAYGHGAVASAAVLSDEGAAALATGSVEQALAIRTAGNATPILMFGSSLPEGLGELLRHDLIPTVHSLEMAEAVSRAARDGAGPAPIYIKVDCGLGRLGVPLAAAGDFVRAVARMPGVAVEGVYTHVPFTDPAGRDWAARKLADFDALVAALDRAGLTIPVTQARASPAILAGQTDGCNAVCVGHILYGLSPVTTEVSEASGFEPVLKAIKTRLIQVSRHAAGRDVAIGGHYGINRARTTGVVPLGLAGGLRAVAGGQAPAMLLRGRRVPVMAVSLEHATLDLGAVEDPRVGEEVVVIGQSGGERITVAEHGAWTGSTSLEVMMAFAGRLPLRRLDDTG